MQNYDSLKRAIQKQYLMQNPPSDTGFAEWIEKTYQYCQDGYSSQNAADKAAKELFRSYGKNERLRGLRENASDAEFTLSMIQKIRSEIQALSSK